MVHDHLCSTAVCPVNGPMVWNWTLISPTSLVFLVADYHSGNSFRPSDPFYAQFFWTRKGFLESVVPILGKSRLETQE